MTMKRLLRSASAKTAYHGVNKWSDEMDKDRIAVVAKQAKGSVEEAAGKTLGDAKLTAQGKTDKARARFKMPWVA